VKGGYSFAATELNLRDTAARYEGGSHNMAGFAGLAASLGAMQEMRVKYGATVWEDSILDIARYAADRLRHSGAEFVRPTDTRHQSGILSFSWKGRDPQAVRARCIENGVVLSCRLGKLRIATHGYNNREDIERLIDVLESTH
jgi:selenocysteine lyase/cysteine desulfurase